MGRHRNDPLGLARIGLAVVGVAVAIGLLIVGGTALWGALSTGSGETAAPRTTTAKDSTPIKKTTPATKPTSSAPASEALGVRCVAAQCKVYIAIPGSNTQVFNGTLNKDEERHYDEPQLTLVVYDSASVDVTINGQLQPKGQAGEEKTYDITKK